MLEEGVVETGLVSVDAFLAGYGVTQAVPGPLFTFAAYLGAIAKPGSDAFLGASIALVGIFLPGMLLLMGLLPFWRVLRSNSLSRAGMAGTNAAVVGVLGTALFYPVWTSAVLSLTDFAIALAGFVLLTAWKAAPWLVVLMTVASTVVIGLADA